MRLTLLESRVTAVQKVVPILSRVVVADEKMSCEKHAK